MRDELDELIDELALKDPNLPRFLDLQSAARQLVRGPGRTRQARWLEPGRGGGADGGPPIETGAHGARAAGSAAVDGGDLAAAGVRRTAYLEGNRHLRNPSPAVRGRTRSTTTIMQPSHF